MKNGKNGKFGLVALCMLFAVFVASGCSSNTQQDAAAGAPISENSTTEEVQQFIDSAVAAGDVGMCLKIPNKMPTCLWTSSCLAQVAEHNKDKKICSKITPCEDAGEFDVSDFAKEQCVSGVELAKVRDVAVQGDYRNCLKLAGTFERSGSELARSDVCLMQVATVKFDTKLCDMIGDADLKEQCLFYSSFNLTEERGKAN